LAQEREYAARSFGPSPAAAASSRQVLILSLKEGRGAGAEFCRIGASICGTTGTAILGGGGGAGGGGLNGEPPGGIVCVDAPLAATSTATITPNRIENRFMAKMS
jgi:hypothetical protein